MTEQEAIEFARDVLNRRGDFRHQLVETGMFRMALLPDPPTQPSTNHAVAANEPCPYIEVLYTPGEDWKFTVHDLPEGDGKMKKTRTRNSTHHGEARLLSATYTRGKRKFSSWNPE